MCPGRRACSAGRRRCRPRVGPGAGIGGIEHRRLCQVDGPGRVVQRVGRVVLGRLGVSLRESAFSLDTFSDRTFARTTAVFLVLLVLSTVLGIFHTVMKAATLGVAQRLICTAVALSVVVAAGIRKAVRRRTAAPPGTQVSR
jgi:hypothetical protein